MTQLHSRWLRCIAALVVLSATVTAYAHPGHGTTNPDSAAHLLEPVHFVTLLSVLCVAGLMGGFLLHRRRKFAKATAAARGRMSRRDDA
jgi:hydrogenase/urease accessory protein HupE